MAKPKRQPNGGGYRPPTRRPRGKLAMGGSEVFRNRSRDATKQGPSTAPTTPE